MYDTILVPTDGSDHAVRAAEHGHRLAETFDATMHVVTVVDLVAAGGPFDAGSLTDDVIAGLEAEGRDRVHSIADALGTDDRLETAVVTGQPRREILAYADEHDAEMIVMGTHGRTGISRLVSGSVTEHVVRRADVPVMTARATDRSRVTDGYDDVLVATDGSQTAETASEHALSIARATGARVHAVHIVDVGSAASTPSVTPPSTLIEGLTSQGEDATDTIATRARDEGLEAVTHVRAGDPGRDQLRYADEHDVDLVVMGTVGRNALDRILVGSTTERVIRRAEMPVLAVRAAAGTTST